MALISCPECNNQVSSTAAACPRCGAPIAGALEARAAGASLTTVQETSKRLKLHTLGAVLLIIIGVFWLIAEINAVDGQGQAGISTLLIMAGLIWYFVTRFRIWWHHK